jgi:hypothetical protein
MQKYNVSKKSRRRLFLPRTFYILYGEEPFRKFNIKEIIVRSIDVVMNVISGQEAVNWMTFVNAEKNNVY